MNSDELHGNWKQLKGMARQQFGRLTESDLEMIAGQRERLIGKLQERYGYLREEAQKRADEWIASARIPAAAAGQRTHMPPPPPGAGEHATQKH